MDSAWFSINLAGCGGAGQDKERRRPRFSPDTHLASHLRHLRASSAASVRERVACVSSLQDFSRASSWGNFAARFRFFIGGLLVLKELVFAAYFSRVLRKTTRKFAYKRWVVVKGRFLKVYSFAAWEWWQYSRGKQKKYTEKECNEEVRELNEGIKRISLPGKTSRARKFAWVTRTVLIKVLRSLRQQVFVRVSKRDTLCLSESRIFTSEACSSLEKGQGKERRRSSPATGKSCLPIYTCAQGRPRGKT